MYIKNAINSIQKQQIAEHLGRVAVLMGGASSENGISLLSGSAILAALQEEGVDAFAIDVKDDIINQLNKQTIDRVFIALHGCGGEDGKIQAVLEWMNIPYTGSGVMTCALTMNKACTKYIWQGIGLSTPKFELINNDTILENIFARLGSKLIVKPCHEGSSLGMSIAHDERQLQEAIDEARHYDNSVLVEEFITGPEYSVSILNGRTLPPIQLETKRDFYDYCAKYEDDRTEYHCPCDLKSDKLRELSDLVSKAAESVGLRGWGRVDVMSDRAGNFYLLEVNTVPGMTSRSAVPIAAKAAGLNFNELVLSIISQTLCEKISHE